MPKFYGAIGFVKTVETSPGIWEPSETAVKYCGDLIRSQRRWEQGDAINEDLNISNEISIVADKFAKENLNAIKWVEVMGSKWRVNSVTISYPRIVLTLGGVYNGG
jgi:hypothetical protein